MKKATAIIGGEEMREIKFRGLSDSGGWSSGLLTVIQKGNNYHLEGHYISNSAGMPCAYKVRPETVGQYTGLEDKNGVEVYEGDIVLCPKREIRRIVWDSVHGCWSARKDGRYPVMSIGIPNVNKETIIGNIYNNPEMLK